MQQLPHIKATYDWVFMQLQTELAAAASQNNLVAINQLEEKRDVFERGIFVLMFGQFENAVNAAFKEALALRSTNPDWTRRRGWDMSALKAKSVTFDTRLSLVMDRHARSFNRVLQTYAIRNHCAHGGTDEPVGSIDALEADLYTWQGQLRRT
jgi:hypothetical protein